MRFLVPGLLLSALAGILPGQPGSTGQEQPAGLRLRRPVALALADGGRRLLVANRDSGTVAVLDTRTRAVTAEVRVGRRLADLAATPGRDRLFLADEEAGEVVVAAYHDGALRVVKRLPAGPGPVGVRVTDDGRLAAVACLWARRLLLLDVAGAAAPAALDLPFAPRRLLLAPGGRKLVVTDAFAGAFAVVDVPGRKVESVRSLFAHNLRGLALGRGGKDLLVTYQLLNPRGRTTRTEIQNGTLLSNHAARLPLAAVLDPSADPLRDERRYPLGDVERGAGDPEAVAGLGDGRLLVALGGVDEVAVGRPEESVWTRLAVGRRPTALAVDEAAGRAYVANTLGDSVSVVDLRGPKVVAEIRLGPPAALRPAERGEMLFYDARLSHDAWFSCQSCHPDGHTPGRLNDNFTDGSFGTPKRILSLLGTRDTPPWAWNGRMPTLEAQVHNSLVSTLQGLEPSAQQVADLTAFLRTLPPPPSVLKARGALDAARWKRGRHVFVREKCAACHPPPTYTSPRTYDVGLRDEAGARLFNPPSLRGVGQAGPYFHDNRARTLEEVFARFRHELSGALSGQDRADLVYFLQGL